MAPLVICGFPPHAFSARNKARIWGLVWAASLWYPESEKAANLIRMFVKKNFEILLPIALITMGVSS